MGTSASNQREGAQLVTSSNVNDAVRSVQIDSLKATVDRQKKEIMQLKATLKMYEGVTQTNAAQQLSKKDTELEQLKRLCHRQQSEMADFQRTINEMTMIQQTTMQAQQAFPNNALTMAGPNDATKNLPKVGDHVVSMWGSSKWQYFTATINGFNPQTLKYTIEWDDHDPTGLVVDYYNLALDKVPPLDQVGVGSKVLFNQGEYKQQAVSGGITRSGGLRWHQGEITRVYDKNGVKLFDGHHTKGDSDGKWVTYKDYSYEFIGYHIDDFRLPPNVFDILGSSVGGPDVGLAGEEIDVFISYAKVNCPSAVINREIANRDLPPSYEQSVIKEMVDPRDIIKRLRDMGVRVFFMEDNREDSVLQIFKAMKTAKVFIACLSDEFASNDQCRMEFQYAKKTLGKPVIPIVVGTGSLQWQLTVVGLLVAGELYIHFKNKDVEQAKMLELVRAVKQHIPKMQLENVEHSNMGNALLPAATNPGENITGTALQTGTADIFFSYCWYNSHEAYTKKQIKELTGNEWNDPRRIKSELSKKSGYSLWIDIERLASADAMGMFGQIASALADCKVAVACVSSEYADSDNCRMEIQFALSSLNRPLIAVVVGKGDAWKRSVVGMLVAGKHTVVNMQDVKSEKEFQQKLKQVIDGMSDILNVKLTAKEKAVFHAPVLGDHVICHHQAWAYFTATIVKFNSDTMEYTVDWDDGDPTGRVQSYENVALNVVPNENEIGIGSTVFFQQGSYSGTAGNNSGGGRYHQGKITKIHKDADKVTRYDGEHTKSEDDGKWLTYGAYQRVFADLAIEQLRISPNAMDALMACKQAFELA